MAKKKAAKKAPAKKKAVPKKKIAQKAPAKKATTKKKTTQKAPTKKATTKKKTTQKAPTKKATTKKKTAKNKLNTSFMKPMQPDATLGAVVGNKPLPRTEVTRKIWAYIKKNNLQDTQNRSMINGDDKLKAIFDGKKQVSMFEMTKLVNKHMM